MASLVLMSDHASGSPAAPMRRWLGVAPQVSRELTLPDRRWLFQAGEPASHVYVLAKGVLEISGPASPAITHLLVAPALVGAEEILSDSYQRRSGARTVGESVLYPMERQQFLGLLGRDPALSREVLRSLASKVCALSAPAPANGAEVETRLAALIAAYMDLRGLPVAEGIHLRLRRSQADLAEALGAAPRSINRVMSRWRRAGLYLKRGGYLTLTNPAAIVALAGELHGSLVLGAAHRGGG